MTGTPRARHLLQTVLPKVRQTIARDCGPRTRATSAIDSRSPTWARVAFTING
jgi:hypothetical protein